MTYQAEDHRLAPAAPKTVSDRWRCTCGVDLGRPTNGAVGALSNLYRHRDAQQADVQATRLEAVLGLDSGSVQVLYKSEEVVIPAPVLAALIDAFDRVSG